MAPIPGASPPTIEELFAMLQGDSIRLRDTCADLLKRWHYIEGLGSAGLQAPPFNLIAADADELFRQFNLVATPALVYYGQAAQASAYNFDGELAAAREGL